MAPGMATRSSRRSCFSGRTRVPLRSKNAALRLLGFDSRTMRRKVRDDDPVSQIQGLVLQEMSVALLPRTGSQVVAQLTSHHRPRPKAARRFAGQVDAALCIPD